MGRLTDPARFRFVFAGGGSRRPGAGGGLPRRRSLNTEFLPYQNHHTLPADHLGRCHVGLVTQKTETCGTVVPSKTYALMAAGRPFIFIGPREATARLVERFRCGWQIDPDDSSALVGLLELLSANPELIHIAGDRGRKAFLDSSDRPAGVARIVKILASPVPALSEPATNAFSERQEFPGRDNNGVGL